MPADLVTLVVWRDAVTDPPDREADFPTDQGSAWCRQSDGLWRFPSDTSGDSQPLDPQPSLWCDPVPPNADAPLTIKNVRRMCDLAWGTAISRADLTTIERLRAWLPKEEPSA